MRLDWQTYRVATTIKDSPENRRFMEMMQAYGDRMRRTMEWQAITLPEWLDYNVRLRRYFRQLEEA